MKNFAEKFAKLRKDKNKTQEDVAKALHVSRQAVSKWETGKSLPSLDMLKDIAALFEVPMTQLFDCESANELTYSNTQELQKIRHSNRLLTIGIAAAALIAILGLVFGLIFGLAPKKETTSSENDDDRFVGLFFDLTSSNVLRDGERVTLKELAAEQKPLVLYTQVLNEGGKMEYRYKVRGIKFSTTRVGSYATFKGTLYYDNDKFDGRALHMYEVYSADNGEFELRYFWRADKADGTVRGYDRDTGFSNSKTSIRYMSIDTSSYKTISKVILTERDANFDVIKEEEIPLQGMEYTLDMATCYVVLSAIRTRDDGSEYTLTSTYTTAQLNKQPSIWLHNNDENGFCDAFNGILTIKSPSWN